MGIRLTEKTDEKTEHVFYRFLLRHPIDLVEIWRKLTYIHHWFWIITEIWICQYRDSLEYSSFSKTHISVIIRYQWWLFICFLHISTRSIEWSNKIHVSNFDKFRQFSWALDLRKFAKLAEKWTTFFLGFYCANR